MPIDPRLQRILEAMRNAAPTTDSSVPNTSINLKPEVPLGGDSIGKTNRIQSVPVGMPSAESLPPDFTQMPRIRIGVSTRGLTGVDKSLTELEAMRQADREGLGTTRTPGFIETNAPRRKHQGFLDHLKALGKTAVIGMGQVAEQHPNASTGELLGAGAAGAAIGGIKPSTGDALLRRLQIQQQEADVMRQEQIAQQQAQTQAVQARPVLEAEKIRVDAEIARRKDELAQQVEQGRISHEEAQRQLEALKQAETERHNRETERLGGERNRQLGKSGVPPEIIDQNIAGIKAQQAKIDDYLNKNPSTITEPGGKYADGTEAPPVVKPNPEYEKAKEERNRLDAEIRDWEGKRKAISQSAAPKLTIEGAIEHFKKVKKRAPTDQEIANMQAALLQ